MLVAAAWLYTLLVLVVAGFQFALAAGASWGHLTMGGQFPGVLPGGMRLAAVAQGLLLLGMALAVLARAGQVSVPLPGWTFWIAVAITALTMVLNLITPSAPERLLWGPVTVAMLVAALIVAFASR